MRIGVFLPQPEMGCDPIAIRDYAQAVEYLGYDHISSLDHVLGANSESRPGWNPPFDHNDLIHEPFVLFGYLSAFTKKIELVTSIVILPQRQTALVAKQAAEIDVLSNGRMRLGIGTGWNDVEYEALGEDFHNRGRRSEEQIEVLRALWTQESVTYNGRWHKITDAGIKPLPIQRPIPVWIGGDAEIVLKRIARIGDGWFPPFTPDENSHAIIDKLHFYAREAGRDPTEIGVEGRVRISSGSTDEWINEVETWHDIGATHLSVSTWKAGLSFPDDHISLIQRFKKEVNSFAN